MRNPWLLAVIMWLGLFLFVAPLTFVVFPPGNGAIFRSVLDVRVRRLCPRKSRAVHRKWLLWARS